MRRKTLTVKSVLREVVLFIACGIFTGTVGLLVVDTVVMPQVVRKDLQVEVPDIVDLTPEQARVKLARRGLRLKLQEPRWDASILEGRLVYQNPTAFSYVKTDRTVYAVPSKGSRLYSVPDLRKKSLRQATLWIEQSGVVIGEIRKEPSPIIKEGLVMYQEPAPGEQVSVGTPVVLVVSDGPVREYVAVPNVIGKDLEHARQDLGELELLVRDIRYEFSTTYLPNTVIYQEPAAGDTVKRGSSIRLAVSKL